MNIISWLAAPSQGFRSTPPQQNNKIWLREHRGKNKKSIIYCNKIINLCSAIFGSTHSWRHRRPSAQMTISTHSTVYRNMKNLHHHIFIGQFLLYRLARAQTMCKQSHATCHACYSGWPPPIVILYLRWTEPVAQPATTISTHTMSCCLMVLFSLLLLFVQPKHLWFWWRRRTSGKLLALTALLYVCVACVFRDCLWFSSSACCAGDSKALMHSSLHQQKPEKLSAVDFIHNTRRSCRLIGQILCTQQFSCMTNYFEISPPCSSYTAKHRDFVACAAPRSHNTMPSRKFEFHSPFFFSFFLFVCSEKYAKCLNSAGYFRWELFTERCILYGIEFVRGMPMPNHNIRMANDENMSSFWTINWFFVHNNSMQLFGFWWTFWMTEDSADGSVLHQLSHWESETERAVGWCHENIIFSARYIYIIIIFGFCFVFTSFFVHIRCFAQHNSLLFRTTIVWTSKYRQSFCGSELNCLQPNMCTVSDPLLRSRASGACSHCPGASTQMSLERKWKIKMNQTNSVAHVFEQAHKYTTKKRFANRNVVEARCRRFVLTHSACTIRSVRHVEFDPTA